MEEQATIKKTKTVCFAFASGCPRSMLSMGHFVEYFKANGWTASTKPAEADLIMVGGCAFDIYNEEKSLAFLDLLDKRRKKGARIIVCGCISGINAEKLHQKYDVITVPPTRTKDLDDLIGAGVKLKDVKGPNEMGPYKNQFEQCFTTYDHLLVKMRLAKIFKGRMLSQYMIKKARPDAPIDGYKDVYEIRVAFGCMGECSYCAIMKAEGPLISRPLDTIISEFESGLKAGKKVFRLIATDVGAYGQDIGMSIVDLLRKIFEHEGHFKLMWDDFGPNWLVKYFPDLYQIITANSDRIGYISFPIQSGSDKILSLMKRKYSAADVRKCVLALRQASPHLDISTHVLIGFPGEDERDFENTINLLRELDLKHIHLFCYSDRPDTLSMQYPDKVDEKVKAKRIERFRRELIVSGHN